MRNERDLIARTGKVRCEGLESRPVRYKGRLGPDDPVLDYTRGLQLVCPPSA